MTDADVAYASQLVRQMVAEGLLQDLGNGQFVATAKGRAVLAEARRVGQQLQHRAEHDRRRN